MGAQPREVKVLAALSTSMTIGFLVLMALGNNPPSAGAFCLSSYYRLEPVETVISCPIDTEIESWKRIKVSYVKMPIAQKSKTTNNQVEAVEQKTGPLTSVPTESHQSRGHFFVCDGIIGHNGGILATNKWEKQEQIESEQGPTIFISVITDGHSNGPTGIQIERICALIVALSKRFDIPPEYISY